MKRLFYFVAIILIGLAAFSSCKGCGKRGGDGDSIKIIGIDSIVTPKMTDIVGVIGDGTSMNVLEVITEDGDTLSIECNDHDVAGGVTIGNKVAITYITTGMDSKIITCINMTALEHVWTQVGMDGHKQSLELDELGVATTYDMSIDYDRWSLSGGKLLLYSPKKVSTEQSAPCDTFDIMELTDSKLVLMHGDLVSEFYCEN